MLINILNEYLCWHPASCTSYTMCLSLSLSPYLFHTVSSHRKRAILALPPQHLSQGKPASSSHPATANYDQMQASKTMPSSTLSLLPKAAVDQWLLHSTPRIYRVKWYRGKKIPAHGMRQPTNDLRDSRSQIHIFTNIKDQTQKSRAFKT